MSAVLPNAAAVPAKGVACNCRADTEQMLTKHFADNTPNASGHQVTLQGYGFAVSGGSLVMIACMQYEAIANYPLKNGARKDKKSVGGMTFNFCPFCGKSTKAG